MSAGALDICDLVKAWQQSCVSVIDSEQEREKLFVVSLF